jgi:ABC-type dipeptide/oligopeptide/nickel transport system ATPase component
MQDGLVVEEGPVDAIFHHPTKDYTAELIAASLDGSEPRGELDALAARAAHPAGVDVAAPVTPVTPGAPEPLDPDKEGALA